MKYKTTIDQWKHFKKTC